MLIPDDFNLESYYYNIPEDKIAKYPTQKRTQSSLLILEKETGNLTKLLFSDIIKYLKPDDLLILNDTRVIKARLKGRKKGTNANIELLILQELDHNIWRCLAKPSKRLKSGTEVDFFDKLRAEVIRKNTDGSINIRFIIHSKQSFFEILDEIGEVPIPPYFKRNCEEIDNERYQTIYARELGAVAAPTAGLHFDDEIISLIKEQGVQIQFITLHTGYGTFKPIESQDIRDHPIHSEKFHISKETYNALTKAKALDQRIIPIGTTSMRVIEYIFQNEGTPEFAGDCDLYIYPGFNFQISKGLLTNFHLPYSSLLVLVSAFAGREKIKNAYKFALENNFRFFSYGDSMLII